MPRASLVAANWKMNGSPQMVQEMVSQLRQLPIDQLVTRVVVCPPFLYVGELVSSQLPLAVGAQDCSEYDKGAYTGETSARMLYLAGCRYVIVGHSERRHRFGENNIHVAAKTERALAEGLNPIVCVGETLEQRENNNTIPTVTEQLKVVIDRLTDEELGRVVVAYEPIWAIGTGRTATPEQAQQVHKALRECLATRGENVADSISIVYGGSVKAANARELFSQADIDGGLIGGASLDAQEFFAICKAAG